MTAPNHALTGALIGLTIHEPALAAPLAFLSHFACDAIPHYDPPGEGNQERLGSPRFIRELIISAFICLGIVACLALTRPHDWLLASVCAFLAASPDLFWMPRFIHRLRTGKDRPPRGWFLHFHSWIQWRTGPDLWWLETIWFVVFGALVAARL